MKIELIPGSGNNLVPVILEGKIIGYLPGDGRITSYKVEVFAE